MDEKAKEAFMFCETNGCNVDFCILINMRIHSGKYRMLVYDFNNQKIERSALCTHGCGKDNKKSTGSQPLFSNNEGSLLTSLGKYKIGVRSYYRTSFSYPDFFYRNISCSFANGLEFWMSCYRR